MLYMGWDTETLLFDANNMTPRVVCLTLSWVGGPLAWLPEGDDVLLGVTGGGDNTDGATERTALVTRGMIDPVWTRLIALAASGQLVLIAHNAPYDLGVLAAWTEAPLKHTFRALQGGFVRDTVIREQLVALRQGWFAFDWRVGKPTRFNLAACVLRHFGVDISEAKGPDAWRTRYSELVDVPAVGYPVAARDYAVEDAVWARRVFLDHSEATIVNEIAQVEAAWALHLMGCYGLRTDRASTEKWEAVCKAKVAEAKEVAMQAGFMRRDGSKDMKVLRAMVSGAYGGNPPKTEGGAVATDRETLANSGVPALSTFAALGVYTRYIDRYVPRMQLGFDAGLTTRWNCLVRSGRTSGEYQQAPRAPGYRECHVPRRGWVYCSVDYDIAELKALAQVQLEWFGHSALADAINSGEDPHLSFGASLLGWTYDEIKRVPKDKTHPDYDKVHGPQGARQLAKIANFGFPGGLGAASFASYAKNYGVVLTEKEARDLKAAWMTRWPEMRLYFDRVAASCANDEFDLVQLFSNRIRGRVGYTNGCNGYFQGLVADFAKEALVIATEASWAPGEGEPLGGCRPVLFIHDEVIMEIPAPWAYPGEDFPELEGWDQQATTRAADRLTEIMVTVAQSWVPDVKMSAHPALMYRWSKGADMVRGPGGLEVWAPGPEYQPPEVVRPPDDTDDLADAETLLR